MTPVRLAVLIGLVVVVAAAIYLATRSSEKSEYEAARRSLESKGIQLGPIRHAELPPNLIDRIRRLEEVFAEVYPISHLQWLDGFQRDHSPERNVALWEQMASAYMTFLNENELTAAGRKEAFRLLLVRSVTTDVESQLSNLSYLTIVQAKSLLALYKWAPQPPVLRDAEQDDSADADGPRR